jgi:diacylglycerol kinase
MIDITLASGETTAAITAIRILTAAFLAVLYLQSGVDKIVDRQGNLEWLSGHFRGSPLAGMVPQMVTAVTITEVAAGALSAVGAATIAIAGNTTPALLGAELSALTLVMLFFGQRMAKDYAGAAVLVPYFILSIVAVFLFA